LKEKKPRFLNLQTGSGLVVIVIGMIYLMQQVGFFPLGFSLGGLVAFLPWLAGILIILTGFGLLSWSPTRRRRKARQKARERRARRERQRKTMGRGRGQPTASRAFQKAKKSARKAAREAERTVSRAASRASQRRSHARKRLAKSRKNKKIAGVAAGIANFLGIDATLVRIAFVIGAIFGSGVTIPLYLILAFVLPAAEEEDEDDDDDDTFIRIIKD
jgi:phage shock protein C